jgi:hypothetical protein
MIEAACSPERLVLTKATECQIPEDVILFPVPCLCAYLFSIQRLSRLCFSAEVREMYESSRGRKRYVPFQSLKLDLE